MRTTRGEIGDRIFAPLQELNPPALDPKQLNGLRSLQRGGSVLKLIYGLRALEPLAGNGPAAIAAALILVTEILSALRAFLSRNPNTSLTDLRAATAATLIDLRPGHDPIPDRNAENFHSPQAVLLEAAEVALLRRARRGSTSAEILDGAARMVLELWESADQLRQSPETNPGAVIHANGWASPAIEKSHQA